MTKKLSERKHSKVVAEAYLDALHPLSHLTTAQMDYAKRKCLERKSEADAAPEHIKIIRKLGVLDAQRGYTDQDVAALIDAEALVRLEKSKPGAFASSHVSKALNSDKGKNQQNRRGTVYPELDVIANDVLSKPKYKNEFDGWITAAILDVENEYVKRYPYEKFPNVNRPKSQTTIRTRLESLKLAANLRHL